MEYFVEQGVSRRDCLGKIVAKYGERIQITRERKVRLGGFMGFGAKEGVELEFYIPPMPIRNSGFAPSLPGQGFQAPRQQAPADFTEAKNQILAAAGRDPARIERELGQQQILSELREIKEKMDAGDVKKEEHPSLVRAAELLRLNDFSENYTNSMLDRVRKELSLETLDNFEEVQDRLLEWIGESIKICSEPDTRRPGRIMALVGPTGVGKTTTIAKLAAVHGIENSGRPPLSVRMITIDAFRIGASAQIEAYGNIMGFPVSCVDTRRDLRKEIALYQEETDLILVDTIGKSPRDSVKLGEMKDILDACGSHAEVHLVLSASTKTSDIEEILRQFEPFNYHSVLLTKLDETSHVGNVISALAERGKSVSYITNGQKVPNDIKRAGVVQFLVNLEDFKINRDKIEKRFPGDEADQFQWS